MVDHPIDDLVNFVRWQHVRVGNSGGLPSRGLLADRVQSCIQTLQFNFHERQESAGVF